MEHKSRFVFNKNTRGSRRHFQISCDINRREKGFNVQCSMFRFYCAEMNSSNNKNNHVDTLVAEGTDNWSRKASHSSHAPKPPMDLLKRFCNNLRLFMFFAGSMSNVGWDNWDKYENKLSNSVSNYRLSIAVNEGCSSIMYVQCFLK